MPTTPRKVVIVAYPDVQTLDVIGPAEVFDPARLSRESGYDVELVARGRAARSGRRRHPAAAAHRSVRGEGSDRHW